MKVSNSSNCSRLAKDFTYIKVWKLVLQIGQNKMQNKYSLGTVSYSNYLITVKTEEY